LAQKDKQNLFFIIDTWDWVLMTIQYWIAHKLRSYEVNML